MVRALEAARRAARRAQEATYEGICTIIGYQDVTDEKTGISSETEVVVAKDQPCKLSFERLGGMILILYLTIFAGMAQFEAQGITLIFFIPIAL